MLSTTSTALLAEPGYRPYQKEIMQAADVAVIAATQETKSECSSHTNPYGHTRIECSDGTRGEIYTDPYGNTSGHLGEKPYQAHTDPYGNTSGSLGNQSIQSHTDPYGNTRGMIGDERFESERDPYGNTRGSFDATGGFNCYSDPYGQMKCSAGSSVNRE